jgi:hypothetical protein
MLKSLQANDMNNIQPAGQMWPEEAFNLARKTQILFFSILSLVKTPFECVKTYQLWSLDMSKKNLSRHAI